MIKSTAESYLPEPMEEMQARIQIELESEHFILLQA